VSGRGGSFDSEDVARLLEQTSRPFSNFLAQATGMLETSARALSDQEGRVGRLYAQIDGLQRENAELRGATVEAERLKQEVALKREELAEKARAKEALLRTAREVGGCVIAELAAARRAREGGASLPTARTLQGVVLDLVASLQTETVERVAVELLEALTPETLERVTAEAGPALLFELSQLLQAQKPGAKEEG
jgi:hypothetical protein